MMLRSKMLVLLIILTAITWGCGEDSTGPQSGDPEAPALPPPASLQLGFDLFAEVGLQAGTPPGAAAQPEFQTRWNFLNAAVRVAVLNLVTTAIVAPPAAAFEAAIHSQPSYIGDATFVWIYTWVNGQGREVEIRLRGVLLDQAVDWELRVSDNQADPPLEQVVWFTGLSDFGNDEGFWILNDIVDGEPVEAARIDWQVDAEDDRRLSFENIYAGHEDLGDTLSYSQEGTVITIEFFDASEDIVADITWDEVTGAGSLQVPDYNDGERACWDEDQYDIECPADPAL
ncbi:MAG: hypothetical protein GF355_13555 [Candidatus Eisenbacteria bacterium]|nr:hypothetical protein [Candidatus Eisenbacteria bacterium]